MNIHPNSLENTKFQKGMISSWKGKKRGPMIPEHKMKISLSKKGSIPWNKGKSMSDEQKTKLKKAWCYEKHVTPNIREKIRNSLLEKWATDEVWVQKELKRYRQFPPKKGTIVSDIGRFNISKSKIGNKINLGHKHSEETKRKIREKRMYQKPSFKDTKPEKMLQIALSLHNIPFVKQKSLPGQPDVFIEPNICVFVDGDYWHANPKFYKADDIMKKGYKAYELWMKDFRFSQKLNSMGYQVIRIWENDIEKDVNKCAENIIKLIQQIRGKIII